MKSKISVIISVILLLSIVVYFGGRRLLFSTDWQFVSSAKSPNGAFTIKYYRSRTEGGHAPYGDNLIIESWKSFPRPKSGETFFAGYCEEPVKYKWVNDEKIVIECKESKKPIRTQASVVHGIKVEVIIK